MTRQQRIVSYTWRLRQVMAQAGMFATTDLIGPLAERGVALSTSQVHRLVTTPPERLNLSVLAALCDILATSPEELILVESANAPARKAVNESPVPRGDRIRPIRAQVVPDTDQG
ncbi:MAG: helix-turn-helix transcriptional regulator [Propionibacteriaceae bacterium]|nr:helix-turn-helix transcriptional regulator [Propionibacteriaceae bacterium]